MAQSKSRLPAGLQEVEYLEGAGVQYMKVLETTSNNMRFIGGFQLTVSANQNIFGSSNGNSNLYTIGSWGGYLLGETGINAGQTGWLQTQTGLLDYHTFEVGYLYAKFDDIEYTNYGTQSIYAEAGLGLFCKSNASPSQLQWPSNVKIYYFQVKESGELIRDFVPCYTTNSSWVNELGNSVPTGTKGMYDLVNGVLYTNRGTGSDFIAGPDV